MIFENEFPTRKKGKVTCGSFPALRRHREWLLESLWRKTLEEWYAKEVSSQMDRGRRIYAVPSEACAISCSFPVIWYERNLVRTDRTKELELNSEDLNEQAYIITYIYKQMTKKIWTYARKIFLSSSIYFRNFDLGRGLHLRMCLVSIYVFFMRN